MLISIGRKFDLFPFCTLKAPHGKIDVVNEGFMRNKPFGFIFFHQSERGFNWDFFEVEKRFFEGNYGGIIISFL